MAEKTIKYNVVVDTESGKVSIDGLTKGFESSEAALSKLTGKTNENASAMKGSESAIRKEISALIELRSKTASSSDAYGKQTLGILKLEIELKKLTTLQGASAKAATGMVNKSGLASAAVVEMGRTVSDSNFGFTAMANNISQLGTLMSTLIATTGGVAKGLGAMWKAMMGPVGLLFVFQIAIALIEKWSIANKKADNASTKLAETLDSLTISLNNNNTSLEDREALLKAVSTLDKDLAKGIKLARGDKEKQNKLLEEFNRLTNLKIVAAEKQKVFEGEAKKRDFDKLTFDKEEAAFAIRRVEIEKELAIERKRTFSGNLDQQRVAKQSSASTVNRLNNEIKAFDTLSKTQKDWIDATNASTDAQDAFDKSVSEAGGKTIDYYQSLIKVREEEQNNASTTAKVHKRLQNEIDGFQKKIDEITGGEKTKKVRQKSLKEFKSHLLNLSNLIAANEKKTAALKEINIFKKLDAEEAAEKQAVERRVEKEKINRELAFDRYKKGLEAKKLAKGVTAEQIVKIDKLISDAEIIRNKEEVSSTEESGRAKTAIVDKYAAIRKDIKRKEVEKTEEGLIKEEKTTLKIELENAKLIANSDVEKLELLKTYNKNVFKLDLKRLENKEAILKAEGKSTEVVLEQIKNLRIKFAGQEKEGDEKTRVAKLEAQAEFAKQFQALLGEFTSFLDAEYQRELDVETNKTNNLNDQLRERLSNEDLSKEERKNIQGQIAANDEALRKKQEIIEKKRFKMQKAANIANAIINTFVAATGVLADTKGGSFSRIAGMIAVIGAGLAQVAVIARQKFASTAGGAVSAGGAVASAGESSPSFNIVGSSGVNQLAGIVGKQGAVPTRAYVVSKDITTQQQLDLNIVTGASIG